MTKKYFSFIVFCGLFIHFSHAQNWGNNQKDTRLFKELLKQTSEAIDYRVSVDRPYDTAVIDDILSFVKENQSDKRAYYFLLQLSWNHPNIYCAVAEDVKTNVLCSGFTQATNVNTWGHLQGFTSAGGLLVDLGHKVLPCLYGLLNDTSRVSYGWNWESMGMAIDQKWRKKDFAYRYAALIVGEEPNVPENPKARDVTIQQFSKTSLKVLMEKSEKKELEIKEKLFSQLLKQPKDYDHLMQAQIKYPSLYCLLSDEIKESLFCEAFYQAKFSHPIWGDLRSSTFNGSFGRLLISLGNKILPCLMLSLKDTSPMTWDSEGAGGRNWRKKDFAHKYMLFTMGEKYVYTTDVAERDSMIEALMARLKKK
jgi:hypothetical protein